MSRYRVYMSTGAGLSVSVEAEDEESAIEAAYDVASSQYLCAQCAGWGQKWGLDLGEWEVDDEPGSVVLEDRAEADQ